MARQWYQEEHEIFRQSFKKFVEKELSPHVDEWEEQEMVPREAWKKMGEQGFLCPWIDEDYGGSSAGFEYSVIIAEELAYAGVNGMQVGLHSDIVVPYLATYANEEQKKRWLPGCASGDILTAVAMTEPGAGSDLQAIRTTAVLDGDQYVINGSKIFISNGICCDLVIVVVKTDTQIKPASKGMSLIVVEDGTPGFTKAKKLKKMGIRSADTAELVFEDCRVPASNLLGEPGQGFYYLMAKLQQERLIAVVGAQAMAEAMLEWTIDYTKQREIFGQPVSRFQHNAFKIVEMATEIELGRTFMDDLLQDHLDGKNIVKKVSMAKWWICEMAKRVADQCVQLHGGYGYMEEYPICRSYRDIRFQTIAAGSTEVMKQIISKMMEL